MNRSDALWELIGDHLVELVELRRREQALRNLQGELLLTPSGDDSRLTALSIADRMDEILQGLW